MTLAIVRRTLAALILVAAALATSATAQTPHVFHPERDLPGFEARDLSEYADLYALDEYKSLDGKTVSEDELAALRQRWNAEKERVAARIALLESDARERWTWQLGKRLARSSGFGKLGCSVSRPAPGVVLVLQKPEREDAERERRLCEFYLPFVERLEQEFVELVAKPAHLERRADQPLTAFAVLASRGDFEALLATVRDPGDDAGRTAYDYTLQLALTCEDPDDANVPAPARRASLLYQVAKELQHAYLGTSGNRPGSIWLYQGLAFLLAAHDSADPQSPAQRPLRPEVLANLVALLGDASVRDALLLPVDELAALRSWSDFREKVEGRAARLKHDVPGDEAIARAFVAQCDLWAHFLFDGAQGAYRKPYLEYVAAAFRGKGDAEDLRKAFVAFDPTLLSRDFLRWACEQQERSHPGQLVDRALIETLFPKAAAGPAHSGGAFAQPAAPGALALVPPSFTPSMLAPDADDLEAESALALLEALDGDLEGSQRHLETLLARAPAAPWPATLARDAARIAELRKLRDGFLAWLQSSGAPLVLKYKGHDLPVVVESVDGARVRLRSNQLGLPSVALAEIDPLLVARAATGREMQGEAQPWARAFACLLGGDARWERLAKDAGAEAAPLRADATEYRERMRTARVARELYELSHLPLPRDEKGATAILERVRALLAAGNGSSLLTRRLDALRQLALAALAARAGEKGLSALLHGKWTALADERGKLAYEFDDPAEEQDWIAVPGFRKSERDSMGSIPIDESATHFAVAKGVFSGAGSAAYRLAVGFIGPVTLRYSFRYLQIKSEFNVPYFAWLLCDDEQDSAYRSPPTGDLYVEDHAHFDVRGKLTPDRPTFDWGKDWNIEFAYDGANLAAKLQGKPRATLQAGQLTRGSVTLLVHSQLPVVFQRVEIEGRFDPSSLDRLRSSWAASELKKLGFP